MAKKFLFEDIFEVKAIDKDGNHFDKVSRLDCRGENFEMDLTLDINIDIYKMEVNQKFTMVLVSSLDDEREQDSYKYSRGPSLLDKFEYCMYGKVFKCIKEEKSSKNVCSRILWWIIDVITRRPTPLTRFGIR